MTDPQRPFSRDGEMNRSSEGFGFRPLALGCGLSALLVVLGSALAFTGGFATFFSDSETVSNSPLSVTLGLAFALGAVLLLCAPGLGALVASSQTRAVWPGVVVGAVTLLPFSCLLVQALGDLVRLPQPWISRAAMTLVLLWLLVSPLLGATAGVALAARRVHRDAGRS